jgi:hypothetical protein
MVERSHIGALQCADWFHSRDHHNVPKASDSRDPGNPGINICIVNNVYYSGIRQYMHLYTVFISFEDFLKKKKVVGICPNCRHGRGGRHFGTSASVKILL